MEQSFSSVVSTTSENLSKLSSSLRGDVVGSPQYQRAMGEIHPLFQPRFFSSRAGSGPVDLVRARLGARVSAIPEEMLRSIPPSKCSYSLWQGFETRGAATLEGCRVRKELAATEIHEIDAQIARLQGLRKVSFDQIASIEQQERTIVRAAGAAGAAGASAAGAGAAGTSAGAGADAGAADAEAARRARRARRQTQPTLQSFYAPGDRIKTLGLGDQIAAIDFDAPFGRMAAAVGPSVQVWELSGEIVESYELPASARCVQLHGESIVAGSRDAGVRIFSGQESAVLGGHLEAVTCVDWSGDGGGSIVSGCDDKTLRQWDPVVGRCTQVLDVLSAGRKHASPGALTSVWGANAPAVGGVKHYGAALAAGTADGVVRLWDMRQGLVVRTLAGHMGPVSGVSFDGTQLVSGSLDRSVRIWDLRTGHVVDTWAYDAPVVSLNLDATRVSAATAGPLVHLYNRSLREHLEVGPGDSEPDAACIISVCQKNGYLVEGRLDGTLGVWAC